MLSSKPFQQGSIFALSRKDQDWPRKNMVQHAAALIDEAPGLYNAKLTTTN